MVVVPREKIKEVLEAAEVKVAYEEKRVAAISEYRKCRTEGSVLPDLTPAWVKEMMEQKQEV